MREGVEWGIPILLLLNSLLTVEYGLLHLVTRDTTFVSFKLLLLLLQEYDFKANGVSSHFLKLKIKCFSSNHMYLKQERKNAWLLFWLLMTVSAHRNAWNYYQLSTM